MLDIRPLSHRSRPLIITGVNLHEPRVAAERFITYLAVEHARVPLHVLREGPARLVELLAVLQRKNNNKYSGISTYRLRYIHT